MATEGENEIETTTMKNNDGGEEENVTEDAKNDVVEDDDIKETAKEEEQDETIVSHKNVELAEEANTKAEGLKERLRLAQEKLNGTNNNVEEEEEEETEKQPKARSKHFKLKNLVKKASHVTKLAKKKEKKRS